MKITYAQYKRFVEGLIEAGMFDRGHSSTDKEALVGKVITSQDLDAYIEDLLECGTLRGLVDFLKVNCDLAEPDLDFWNNVLQLSIQFAEAVADTYPQILESDEYKMAIELLKTGINLSEDE